MTTTYPTATVTFSDGREQQFTNVTVHDNGTLEAELNQQFTPSVLGGLDATALRWSGKPCEVTDTVVYASHEWRCVAPKRRTVLCALIYDPSDRRNPTSAAVVRNEFQADFVVSGLIHAWLVEYVASWGQFQGTYPDLSDVKDESIGRVSDDAEMALAAKYVIADNRSPQGARGYVKFWQAASPLPEPAATASYTVGEIGGGALR